MATKRAPSKDLDVSSMQLKQPRLETMSQSAFYNTKPVSSTSHTDNRSSLPATELHVSAPIPISPLTPNISSSPTHVIGVPTWSSPGKTSLDFHSTQGDTGYVLPVAPTQKPPDVTPALQQDSYVAPLFVVPVGMKQEMGVPGSAQFVRSGLTKQGGVTPTSELRPYTDTTSVLSSLSSLQPLHLPVSNSSSHFSSSTSSPTLSSVNRQPVCLVGRNGKSEPKSQKTMKHRVLKYHRAKLASLKLKHEVDLKEKFFLETGGNMMDIVTWKKRPSVKRDKYLKLYDIESDAPPCDQHTLSPDFHEPSSHPDVEKHETAVHKHEKHSKQQKIKSEVAEGASVTSTTIQIPLSTVSRSLRSVTPSSPVKTPQIPASSPRPVTRLHSSFSSFYETSHEDIVMRARHEAEVMRAIGELRKEGLWSSSRLPKVHEPPRKKTHWDYMLEEMQWLAADFANERRWKINAAKKISRSVSGYYRELEMQQVRTEKEEALKLKKIALSIAKEIKHFWESIQKVVLHKQQLLLEEKKKRAMDMHLEFIVDQTAKYSNWLVKGLTTSSTATPSEPSLHSAATSIEDSDAFLTPEETSDDEETIEKEEQLMEIEEGKPNYATEIKALEEEGAIPLEQLLASLPSELLKKEWMVTGADEMKEEMIVRDHDGANSCGEETESTTEKIETTIGMEESKLQKSTADVDDDKANDSKNRGTSHKQAQLVITGSQKIPKEKSYEDESHDESLDGGSKGLDTYTSSSEDSGDEADSETNYGEDESGDDGGLEFLVSGKRVEEVCQTEAGFSDVAAVAEQFQPKGITLATTEVKTKIPFLLKHSLREYQHIGLDWLVAMHEKRLNGILADEMGLGKTIQTIALLAHLACEEGNWGPHLIVVPTSVMLNWEYELKKWCPAFKLLTYFGSFKERKQKRIGWTKRNAFHVCITSYNIAVTDHRAFKQMKWKYLVLDEAQNIKNFKSQRWQTLLAFNSQRRLLLTGTPLQNNLMELWSLMHFLMPSVFSSHSDFKEWFSNPLTGMVEGSQEYNDSIVKRLHQVLRPFLLRRLKMEVEKQMPKKYEHVVICRLSKRQRFLYDEYMSRRKTKDTLSAGNYLSVINILMQLRKVCNHPDLFEPRPIVSPLRLAALEYYTASLLFTVYDHNPFKNICLDHLNLQLASYELDTEAFAAFRSRQLQAPKPLICDPLRSQLEDKDEEEQEKNTSLFLEDLHLPYLVYSRQEWSISRRKHMHEVNSRRCRRIPMYGTDLVKAVRNMSEFSSKQIASSLPWCTSWWLWSGYMACKRHLMCTHGWEECSALEALLLTHEQRFLTLEEILKRFIITMPPVTAPSISVHTHLYTPARLNNYTQLTERIARHLAPRSSVLHFTSTNMALQFPETRLIQYDCGKLQTLDVLLRNLKTGNHRVLVFTQMARVLDVLEIFLNYHGHTYLRLDGATPVQKRQVLMDQFNHDERIFCFILSTRSGGLGVNLTGADTVVFYDSDWNPTMDAQAQDRCHRIGQTRDVHIYRLVCESTVEENILKKANQKRMLGDIAIEGGVFTTDFFKEATLRDLFQVKSDVQLSVQSHSTSDSQTEAEEVSLSSKCIEDLLMQAEDERDVQAASMAKAEQVAEKAEFDEDFCTQVDKEHASERSRDVESDSKVLTEFAAIEHQLSGIERYAMRYLEEENADIAAEQLKIAEESIKQAKKSWELSHMQSLREEEERIAEEDAEDDIILSYDRPELANKIFVDKETGEEMPMWLPPTPPVDDGDEFYVDVMMDMAYDTSSVITPAELASIAPYSEEDYDVLGLSRRYQEIESSKKPQKPSSKLALKEHVNVPSSLFWRRYATDTLSTKLKKLASHQKKLKVKDQFTPLLEQQPEGPEWSLYEDWLLLKGITEVLEFPLSLAITVPAQVPNWSIIADLISLLSQVRRSPLQCREHLMNVVIPREDSSVKGDDSVELKKHKSKDSVSKKLKSRKEQKIKHTVVSDGGKEQTKLFTTSFDKVLETVSKRKQKTKFSLDSVQKPSIHTDLMKNYDIRMDSVLSPMQIAYRRVQPVDASRGGQGSQVQQLLSSQPHQASLMRGYGASGAPFMKSSTGYNLPRQISTSIAISTASAQRFQPVSSATTSFTSSQLPQVTSTTIPSPVLPSTSQATPSSTSNSQQSTPISLLPNPKTASIGDISKTLRGSITHQQLLMLRQGTLQQQVNASHPQSSVHVSRPLVAQQQTTPIQAPSPSVTQKVALASIALPAQQRFGAITSVSGGRGLAGRNLQEDVIALLKQQQQSLRLAASHTVPSQLHPQAHFPFRSDPGHSTTKVQHVPTAIVPPEAIKLVSTSNTVTDTTQAQQKVEGMEQNQGVVTTKQFSAAPTTTAINISFGPQQPSSSVNTTAAQNLVTAQLQRVLAQQQQIKSHHGGQLPKTTSQ